MTKTIPLRKRFYKEILNNDQPRHTETKTL